MRRPLNDSTIATKLNHYSGDGDSPSWILEDTTTGIWTRNVPGTDGDLAAAGAGKLLFE